MTAAAGGRIVTAPPVEQPAAAGGPPPPGPKGRDDDELAAALRVHLRSFGDIDVADVAIAVDDGRTTLTGRVADARARRKVASRVAEALGVTAVENQLDLREA
jgi:osmotically-inducible protein OsmY